MRSTQIDSAQIRRKYRRSLSAQVLTDIISTVELEVTSVMEDKPLAEVKDTLQKIVSHIYSKTNQLYAEKMVKIVLPLTILSVAVTGIAGDYRKLIGGIYVFLSLFLLPITYSLAFEEVLKNIKSDFNREEQDTYAVTFNLLETGWKPRTEVTTQDSVQMRKKVVLAVLEAYLEQLKLQEQEENRLHLRFH